MYSPYRKKKFKSDFMNTSHEKYLRFRKKMKAFLKKFMEKGHERLTLMLIPHSEKKIFNFQISNFTISFFVIILIVIVTFSILSLNDNEASQSKISKLSSISKSRAGQIVAFKERATLTIQTFSQADQQIERLWNVVGQDDKKVPFPIYGKGGIDYTINAEMQKKYGKNFSFPEEVKELDTLNQKVLQTTDRLKRINTHFDNLKKVLRFTPSIWPIQGGGGFITSRFGPRPSPFTGLSDMHTGVDIAWWPGTPVRATADGEITGAGMMGGYGLCVTIKHKYGFLSRYAHLQSIKVGLSQDVQRGDQIGTMGNTGNTTGYHLHYEVILGTTPVNPEPYLASRIF